MDLRLNRLAKEKSPYLLQHQYNPVDWFPWGEEAFAKAKAEDKPIFLSIGYSTCHWCHVMERESFEDEEVAALLNEHFVAIKVDREERPDLDHLYMAVCQAMTGQGGWPLTVVLTPDKQPFFAGTYFPKQRQYGRFGMMELLPQINGKWKSAREKVLEAGRNIVEETEKRMLSSIEGEVSEETLHEAFESYAQSFDNQYGGFGTAPKFPAPHSLMYLLRYYERTGKDEALHMVETTLNGMFRGGLYDHIGFGFARYATDERWLIPHFEKMLYDNAMLAMTYTEAYQVTGRQQYRDIAEQVFTYILRDMTDEDGGFYCAEDADSEGEEGKFYVWEPDEVHHVLGDDQAELMCDLYDISEEGNFDSKSIPNLLYDTVAQYAARKQIAVDELAHRVEQARIKLFAYRKQRVHPHKDDKILTSWNGLMIAALAKASKAFDNSAYADAAARAVACMEQKLVREDGRLLARYRDGDANYLGYIDDYAFYIWGLIELYEATFEAKYFKRALELSREMIRLFWDEEDGAFFFYGHDAERLFARMKETYDGAIPAGNSVAALSLLRLARMTGDRSFHSYADRTIQALAGAADQYPIGHAFYMMALDYAYGASQEIVIAGEHTHAVFKEMAHAARIRFRPYAVLLHMPADEEGVLMQELSPSTADKTPIDDKPAVYICQHFACQKPSLTADALR